MLAAAAGAGRGAEAAAGAAAEVSVASAALQSHSLVHPTHSALRCREPGASLGLGLAVGVKTTRFHHGTRAAALWGAWGSRLGRGLTFASDAPLEEAADWEASVLVVENSIDEQRGEPYVPPWRNSSIDPDLIDPFAMPQLTRRVAALVKAMYDCWGTSADWFLIVDDDTFVRPELLAQTLRPLNASELHLMGLPTKSDKFVLASHAQQHGPSVHCGGSSVLLSRALMARVAEYADTCIEGMPRTTLAWYWDEVELLGRCLYERLRLNCSEPPKAPVFGRTVELGLMMAVKDPKDLEALEAYVEDDLGGVWQRLPIAALHPVEHEEMRWLGERFGAWPEGVRSEL